MSDGFDTAQIVDNLTLRMKMYSVYVNVWQKCCGILIVIDESVKDIAKAFRSQYIHYIP